MLDPQMPEFSTFENGYSPDRFYTRPPGDKTLQLSARVPEQTMGMLSELISSGEFPALRTMTDAVNDMAWHYLHLRWMQRKDPELSPERASYVALLAAEMARDQQVREQTIYETWMEVFKAERDPDRLRAHCDNAIESLSGIRSAWVRKQLLDEIQWQRERADKFCG